MALDMTYTSGEHAQSIRLTDVEWECINRLIEVDRTAVGTLFHVRDFGEPIQADRQELIIATDSILALLRTRKDLMPTTYEMRVEFYSKELGPDGHWCGGGRGGLRIAGDTEHAYSLWVGAEKCEIEKIGIGPDGRGVVVGREDLRDRGHIDTENCGRIDFRRKVGGSGLKKKLTALREFLVGLSEKQVSKTLC